VGLILTGRPSRPGPQGLDTSPISVAISTPSPLPPVRQPIWRISDPPGRIRLCAGEGVRFINDLREPVILTASDFSFSSGVVRPGDAFAVLPASGVVVAVSGLDGAVMKSCWVEVVTCEEPPLYP